MSAPTATPPFAPFEWMLSLRYLRARRREGFISVIAGFSFLGILLGVATLIIVMAVMNGFRQELLGKILGLNGHLLVQPLESPLTELSRLRIHKRDLLNARVVIATYNQHIGSFLPSLGLVGTTKSTQVQGADIVMKSLSPPISG